jgi:two-component system, cell cycle response regulator
LSDQDEKTRVTEVVQAAIPEPSPAAECVVVIYTTEPALLGKRFVLDQSPIRIGRGHDSQIVLEGDSVSRRHAHIERRSDAWFVVDNRSTNGTYVNEEQVQGDLRLENGDRIKVGPTILKFLSGADAEAKYHEEIYRMTIIDGLTQIHNKRYLIEALDRDVLRARRYGRDLSMLMFDIDHFKNVNDRYGHLAGDHVLRELARVVSERIRREEVFARYGGEEFALILPETALDGARQLGESLRQRVEGHDFVFQGETIPVTMSMGAAALGPDMNGHDLITAADAKLYQAKRSGRNRVVV